jgi:hypothetical protein
MPLEWWKQVRFTDESHFCKVLILTTSLEYAQQQDLLQRQRLLELRYRLCGRSINVVFETRISYVKAAV